jgi:hypothetical protein
MKNLPAEEGFRREASNQLTRYLAVPQQGRSAVQHSAPGKQHFCSDVQQALRSSQQASACSQQSSLAGAAQQALAGLQQASEAEQQSADFSSAVVMPTASSPNDKNAAANNLVNMKVFSSEMCAKGSADAHAPT